MKAETQERAKAIARFLAELPWSSPTRVGIIAQQPGCPIRPDAEARYLAEAEEAAQGGGDATYWLTCAKNYVGGEKHCKKITAALNAAVELGLVEKTRDGDRGPWQYRTVARLMGTVLTPLEDR